MATAFPLMMTSGPTARSPGSGIGGIGPGRKDSSAQEKTCGLPGLPAAPEGALVTGLVAGAARWVALEAAPPVHPAMKTRRRRICAFCSVPRESSPRARSGRDAAGMPGAHGYRTAVKPAKIRVDWGSGESFVHYGPPNPPESPNPPRKSGGQHAGNRPG